MEIIEGMTDEKFNGEDSIHSITHCRDEAIEDVIDEYLMTPAQAEASNKVSKLGSSGPPIGAKVKSDALDDIWSPSPESRSVSSVLPAIVTGKELTSDVSFSRTQSWIDASAQEDLITSSRQPDDSETLVSLEMRTIRNSDDSSLSSLSFEMFCGEGRIVLCERLSHLHGFYRILF